MSLLALLKARLHSQSVTRRADTLRAQRRRVVKASLISGRLHQAVGLNFSAAVIAELAVGYLWNSSVTISSLSCGITTLRRRLSSSPSYAEPGVHNLVLKCLCN